MEERVNYKQGEGVLVSEQPPMFNSMALIQSRQVQSNLVTNVPTKTTVKSVILKLVILKLL